MDMAEVFAEMCWHFVYFERPMLVTSDSPISMWRRDELDAGSIGMGPKSVDEVRLPLAPTLALVMTWEKGDPRRIRGDVALARELNIGTCRFSQQQRIFVVPNPPPAFPETKDEIVRRPVVADLSVLPPLQAHRLKMGEELFEQMRNIPGLEEIAEELAAAPEPR